MRLFELLIFFQTFTLIVGGILAAISYLRKQKKFKQQKQVKKLNQKQKKSALATITFMQLGFVVCLRRSSFFFTICFGGGTYFLVLVITNVNKTTKEQMQVYVAAFSAFITSRLPSCASFDGSSAVPCPSFLLHR